MAGVAAGSRVVVAQAALWLLVALLAVRQAAAVLRTPRGERLTDLETWIGEGGVLHVTGSLYDADPATGRPGFTGTPFSGLVLKPLTRSAEQALGVAWTFSTLLLVVVLGLVVARALPGPVSRRTSMLAAPVAISLFMLSLPVRNAFTLGQTSIIPVLLVLLGCFAVKGEQRSGVLIGLGAALQPAMLLFAPLLWFTGRQRAAASAWVTFAACTLLAWAAMPGDSLTYWVHHLAGAGLGGSADSLANQSLHGALLRLGIEGPPEIALLLALGATVAVVGLRRAVRYARDGQLLLAVAVTGCVAVAVSPTAWQHQLLWVLLAVVGRVGRRASDRPVWPVVVVLVMSLKPTMLLPNIEAIQLFARNGPLIAALAAACVVPFLPRTSEVWARPLPAVYVEPVSARWARVPLAPFWRRVTTRPNLVLELLVIRVVYSAYSEVRASVDGSRGTAEKHGDWVLAAERFLGIDIEHWANRTVTEIGWLEETFNFYYTSFHFIVPLAILGVLYARRPGDYRWARSSIGFATLLALLGFWLFPLAPPRLMPGMGFVDTVHGPQDFSQPDYGAMTEVTNQYAAMPSLHFGWSLWCGVVVVVLAPKLWMKLLGLVHPTMTVFAIVATANHWVLDAVGGAAVVAAGFGLTYALSGPRRTLVPETASVREYAEGSARQAAQVSAGEAHAQVSVRAPAEKSAHEAAHAHAREAGHEPAAVGAVAAGGGSVAWTERPLPPDEDPVSRD
ncbi:bifunctional glycosyltransferase 87/phosphatase PAP2 family protein [Streptomyces sp. GC420]|uniref:bifunctional glycosyltransferase 87/phosphatase PAP2 family protein n=1 Tax=Streptomyces sp. GC420 TaxID=2697568 RepID=UPI0037DA1A38